MAIGACAPLAACSRMSTSEARIPGPSGAIGVDDGGAGGLPVVFVHSLAGTGSQWNAQLLHLRLYRRAVAIDLMGHGRSDPPRGGDYSLDSLAGGVAATVDALRLGRVFVVGHSMGGGVALAYAAAHPERVAGLLLVDPIDDPSRRTEDVMTPFLEKLQSPEYEATIEAYWRQILEGANEDVMARVLGDLKRTPSTTVVESLKAMEKFDAAAEFARYRGPALSIVTRFNDVPSSLHKVVPGLRHTVISGTSHWIQMDRPEEFNRVMDEFIVSVEGDVSDTRSR